MATDGASRSGPVPIAPAPARAGHSADSGKDSIQPSMPFICRTCARRKVKCDKAAPTCSRCRKGGFSCVYQAPQPRSQKRKLGDDTIEKLAHYEKILRENGLLDTDTSETGEPSFQPSASVNHPNSVASKTGKLLTGHGRSRYIDSHMWHNLGDDEMQDLSNDEEENETNNFISNTVGEMALDPLSGALLGCQQDILQYHPSHVEAMHLWKMHAENVEPICKVLHIPSTAKLVESVSEYPETASRTDECLLFAIYHCAIYSISAEECKKKFGQNRSTMMQRFSFAARQALVNASFLRTTEISVLQGLYLFLLSSRSTYDPHTYWILTGISARIGQRIGLHRDGEGLGLPPFEVEMRRRLFYQVFPHDSRASQSAGIDYVSLPEGWDTKPPLNINDDQIWPGMTEKPVEQNGATDMIFCLSRACIGKRLAKSGGKINGARKWSLTETQETEKVIAAAESEVEEKFIRYCDIVNPLHFLTIGLARSGVTAMRLKLRLPKIWDKTATKEEKRALIQLAQKTLDTDAAVHAHGGTDRFQWHIKPFFLWGTRDSFIFMLATLLKDRAFLSHEEIENAWKSIAQLYQNHDELFEGKKVLDVALGRLTLKAWDSWQSERGLADPEFIGSLRHARRKQENRQNKVDDGIFPFYNATSSSDSSLTSGASSLATANINMDHDFEFDMSDWINYWQL
ncbi:uncharacterized protein N7469_003724 [Penicillium citrinum]|uniref:Zn(2)-C6 fungal-type domain-containing protein n=1 Tax=Penicillium citrinum TaxID=5077 RepID=A0A9W9P332_PENCI|nr:uncharacterized protein N7469_003724 [Penicillium citrinum]KAJ5234556.1 hypothetical protein N7469_003724 [Penicillium citrinum]